MTEFTTVAKVGAIPDGQGITVALGFIVGCAIAGRPMPSTGIC